MSRISCCTVSLGIVAGVLLTSCSSREPRWTIEPANKGTVMVLGQTATQGAVPWKAGLTVRQSLANLGGGTPFANLRQVHLVTRTGRSNWEGQVMQERVINIETGKPDVAVPDQSVIIVPEKKITF